MLLVGIGQVWADDPTVTIAYSTNSTTNMTGNNDAATVGLDASSWSVVGAKGGSNNFPGLNKNGYIALYYNATASNTLTVTNLDGATISEIAITYVSGKDNGKVLVDDNEVSISEGKYSIGASSFVITNGNTSNVQVQIKSIVITYSGGTTPAVLQSIAVSGTPTTTSYEAGTAFDPAGLVVTGTYDVGDPAAITSNITWTACKTESGTYVALDDEAVALAKDETGIYVKATVSEKTSAAFHVTGLTVTAAAPKITITQTSSNVSGSSYGDNTFTQNDVTFSYTQWMKSNSLIQAKASQTPSLKNTTTIPGVIKKITVVTGDGKTARAVTVKGCATADGEFSAITAPATSMSMVFDFGENEYYFFELNTPGNACYFDKIIIEYEEAPEISGIAIKTSPTKTTYTALDNFNPAGLVLTVNYEGGSSKDVTYNDGTKDAFSFSPALDAELNATHTEVTVTYGEKTANQAITVNRIETSLEWSQSEFAVLVGATSPSYPTLTKTPNDLTGVTYSSSNEDVALINENTGEILLGDEPGSSTITASFVQTDVYAAAEDATYTLTLSAATSPYLEVDPTALNFGDVAVDGSKGLEFTLSGSHLEADASLAITGAGASMFSVASSVAKDGEGVILEDVTVTYAPTAAGTHSATLTITSSTASATVALSGTAKVSHTITWSVGGTALSGSALTGVTTSVLDGNGITALPADPDDATLDCANKFMGWSRSNLGTTLGQNAPSDLFTEAANAGTIEGDVTFYAVFATSGEGGSFDDSKTLVSKSDSKYYQSGYITGTLDTDASWTTDAFTAVQHKISGNTAVSLGYDEIRIYANHSLTFTPSSGTTITSIVATAGSEAYATALGGSSLTNCTKSVDGTTVTITPTDGTAAVAIENSAQSRLNSITVNYQTAGGTTYSNYVTKCAAVAAPTFSPAGGTYTAAQNVELSCATEGEVTIKYTTDGTEPSKTVGESYSEAIAVNQSMTIKAIAIKGEDVSELATAAYVLQVPTPTISGTATFLENTTVTITCEGADAIYYTTNGDDPTTESTPYTAPFTVDADGTTTVKAIAVKANWENSAIESQTFTKLEVINVETALGLTSPANGKNVVGVITDITEVNTGYHNATYTISDVVDGVATHSMLVYRGKYLNNTDFTATDQIYVGARVIVCGNVTEHSSINQLAQGNYLLSIEAPAVAAPTFTPDGGGFVVTTDVAISCATDGSEIYYTLDESNPTKSSTHYTEPVTITENKTFKAIAYVGDESSFVVAKTFTLTDPQTVEAAYDALDTEDPINNVAVEGIVYQVDVINGYATYWISDDGTEAAKVLEVYQGKSFDGANFAANGIRVGDKVIVFGNLTTYSTTKEFAAGSRLLSLERKTVTTVTVTGTPSKTSYKVGDAFDPTGLTVTLTYSDDSEATVAVADCSWEKDPATFSETGTDKSVSVKATYDEVQSAAFVVSGLTVTETPNFNLADHEWIKVTSASKLVAGRYYVIASEEKGKVTNRTITSGYLGEETAVFADGVIAYNGFGSSKSADQSNASIFELGGTTDAWTLTEVVNGKLLTGATTANLAWDGATNTTWAITIDGGDAIIGASDGNYIRHNYGSTRFKPYSGTQNAMKVPQLYMWATLSHSVTFDANGGVAESVPGIERTDEGKIIIPATEPTHSDVAKAFAGWYKDGAPSTLYNAGDEFATNEDVTLYAKWNTVPTYTVSYSANGGTGAAPAQPVTVKAGTTITVVENTGYTNPGKTFDGWLVTYNNGTEQTIDLDENSQFSMPAYNVVIKATWAEESNQKWALVTAASQLVAGAKYIIAAAGYDYAMAGQKTNNRDATAVVKRNEGAQLKGTASMQVITLEGTTEAWEFNTGAGYLYAAASGSNHLKTQETNDINGKWTITISEGVASIVASGSSNRNVMQFNNGSSKLFSCYSSASEKAVALYKEIPMTEITTNDMDQDDVPDGGDMTIKEDKTWTVSSAKEVGDVYMEEGAVIANSAAVTANDLYFKTKAGKSNQIHEASQLNVIGDLYYDVQLCSGSLDADYWYIIAVPFDVNINDGISLADGTPMINGVDYEVWIYDTQKRAQTTNGWKRANGKMEAGKAYFIGFNPGMPNTVRLKAAPGWKDHLFSGSSLALTETAEEASAGDHDNWNGIANPKMRYVGIDKENVQMYSNETHTFSSYTGTAYDFVVGTAFFVKSTGNVTIADGSHSQFLAPKRDAERKLGYEVRITPAEAAEFDNQIIVRASESANGEYNSNRDMLTLNEATSKSAALLWTENYGDKRLAIEEAPLVNSSASYVLGIYAPADGEYTISTPQAKEDVSLYLTREGRVIWDLTAAPYTLDLTKGNTTGYGLRIVAAPKATTDLEDVQGDKVQCTKVLINNHVFILRGEKMYDVTGGLVK